MIQTLVYDGTFAGFLSAVFDVYEYKFYNPTICPEHQRQDSLFGYTHIVHTDQQKAERVWKGLKKYMLPKAITQFHKTFLSEQRGMEDMLLEYAQYIFKARTDISQDYSNRGVRYVGDMAVKVHREKHRMEAFVRFQKTADDLFFSVVEPDFNVLPLIIKHFSERYADQKWLIYDKNRKYGIHYDMTKTTFVQIDMETPIGHAELGSVLNESEHAYQQLWRDYFNSTNIKARKNMKLHIRHMPLRYWKYLTEKLPEI
jgi:probable DNA metabolism protein